MADYISRPESQSRQTTKSKKTKELVSSCVVMCVRAKSNLLHGSLLSNYIHLSNSVTWIWKNQAPPSLETLDDSFIFPALSSPQAPVDAIAEQSPASADAPTNGSDHSGGSADGDSIGNNQAASASKPVAEKAEKVSAKGDANPESSVNGLS